MGLIISPNANPQLSNLGTTALNAQLNMVAGTTGISPIKMLSGTNLTSAAAGTWEFDGKCFYSTPVNSARGVSPSVQFALMVGDFGLTDNNSDQNAFPTVSDVWTLEASTSYFFDGQYYIATGANSHSVAMGFTLGGSASITSILYSVLSWPVAINTATATQTCVMVTQTASTAFNQAGANAVQYARFSGHIRMNAGGTVTPIIKFSAAPGGVNSMKGDSYIRFYPVGLNTVTQVGNVA